MKVLYLLEDYQVGKKTIIDRCTKLVFEKYEESNYSDKSLIPTLPIFYDTLKAQPEKEAQDHCTYHRKVCCRFFRYILKGYKCKYQ